MAEEISVSKTWIYVYIILRGELVPDLDGLLYCVVCMTNWAFLNRLVVESFIHFVDVARKEGHRMK